MTESKRQTRYYFNRGQLLVVAASFAVTSVIIFLLGVWAGQKVEQRKLLKAGAPLAKIPIQPDARRSPEKTSSKDEMTFYDTLAKGPGGKAVSKKTTKELPDRVPEPKAKAEKIPTKEQPNEAVASAGDKADPKAKTEAKPVEWTVQVNAFQAEKDAKSLVKKLVDRGYDAYVVPVDIKGRTWHRVRVGRFTKREEAQELQATLQTKEKLTQARSVSR